MGTSVKTLMTRDVIRGSRESNTDSSGQFDREIGPLGSVSERQERKTGPVGCFPLLLFFARAIFPSYKLVCVCGNIRASRLPSSLTFSLSNTHKIGQRVDTEMMWPAASVQNWWDEMNDSSKWQDVVFYFLCAAYSLVSAVALIQVVRIQLRVPEYGWTTQKVFHFMNFIVNGVRAVVFGFHKNVFLFRPRVFTLVLLDLPGILFFSTYTLLVLFWAEIYHQARSLPSDKLRIIYIIVNCGIYVIQVCIWIYLWIHDNRIVESIGSIFVAVLSFIAAVGFILYGGRLFCMLRQFPIESKGRQKKLHEVGSVTAICFTCFLVRCCVVGLSAFDTDMSLDVLNHPILDLIYYTLTEILPSVLVLYILRKLPPRRVSGQYHPIR
ncbi:tobamovirus multiplication protein 1-like isoform X1 [Musa acuminata AAA Group]|uniref:tobamovirus multiplication protein 1-like isoform X1 n=1 Tax=Musa acuminata AAA Group TaxID=214697 RepID=UPI0031D91129